MRNLIILVLAFLMATSTIGYSQKLDVDKKSGLVMLDGEKLFKIFREGGKDYYFTVKNLEDEKLFIVSYKYGEEYLDGWFEFVFLDSKEKVAVKDEWSSSRKILSKHIYKNDLIKDGKLDAEAVEQFILIKGIEAPRTIEIKLTD